MSDAAKQIGKLTEKARWLGQQGNTDPQALEINTRIIQLDPHRYEAYIRRGIYYQNQGCADDAEKDFRKALELKPENRIALDRLEQVIQLKAEIAAMRKNQRVGSLKVRSSYVSLPAAPLQPSYHDIGSGWREQTPLHKLGYKITGRSRHQRWQVLINRALPQLGLPEVAYTIANNCRLRRLQYDGEERYSHALGEWEHDLARLKEYFYDGSFRWPSTEPD